MFGMNLFQQFKTFLGFRILFTSLRLTDFSGNFRFITSMLVLVYSVIRIENYQRMTLKHGNF